MCALVAPIENVSCRHGSGAALAVLLEPVGEVAYAWAAGGDGLVPVSERYLVHKFESILVMQLSVNIITAAAAVDPSRFPARQRTTLRVAALASYAHFVNFKLLGVDVDSGARLRDPFLFRQSPSRILYRLQQPVLICFINAAAAGMARLVARPVAKIPDADLLFARRVACGAGQESEIPNFKGSFLGRFPLVSADFWTSDHLSERSRSVDVFLVTRARGTLTLKRR